MFATRYIVVRKVVLKVLASLTLLPLSGLHSQTIQLGAGTAENWDQSSSPVNIYYRRTVCQFVYTAAELSAAGASTINPITELGFYVTEAPVFSIPGYTIKIKHTTQTDVSAALGTTGWTTVKNSFTYTPTAGDWDMITLDDQTFVWDGTSSIGVEICWSRVTPIWNASGTCRIYGTTNGYRYSWTDAAGSSCGSTPATITTDKPQIQMVFVAGNTTTWNGSVSTDWFNQSNWSAGVPSSIMHASIPAAPANQPVINGEATTNDIVVDAGASLTFAGDDTLNIWGNWDMNGTLTAAQSTVLFRGFTTTTNLMDGVNNQSLYNLEVRSTGGLTLNSGSYEVTGSLRLRGATFTANNRVTLSSTSSSTGRLSSMDNLCDYELDMSDTYGDGWNGGLVTVEVDGEVYGAFNAEGTGSTETVSVPNGSSISLIYSAGRYENENTYDFNDPLGTTLFSDGPTPTTGTVYTTTATCTFSNSYSGNLIVQRYLSLSTTGWREMSGGVTAQTLSNWQDDGIIMTGFTGSDYPGFGWESVYTYEENNADGDKNNGWATATNITNSIDPAKGHRVYIGNGTYTTQLQGPPITGDYSFTLDYQDDPGAFDEEGWNLIANPYACTINWDSIPASDKVNIDDAIWVWNATAGNYGMYSGGSGGTGTNDVGADIASSQAFWVHATATGPSLDMTENVKVERDPTFVKSLNTEFLKIRLEGDPTDYYDEVVLSWKSGASPVIDAYDGYKLFTHLTDAPSISFKVDSVNDLSINVVDASSGQYSVPLHVNVGLLGTYRLNLMNVESLDPTTCLILEDLVLDSLIDIHSVMQYQFTHGPSDPVSRFMLHTGEWYSGLKWERCNYHEAVEPGHLTSVEETEVEFNIFPNPASDELNVQITQPAQFDLDKIEVVSLQGQLLLVERPQNLVSKLNINSLTAGTYLVRLVGSNGEQFSSYFVKN